MFHPLPPHTIRVRDTGSTTDKSNLRLPYVAFAITSILFSPYDQPRGPELVKLVAPSFHNVFIGLFMRDFYNFMEEVTSGKIDQEMKDRTLRAFQIAEDIHRIIIPKSNF